MTVFLDQFEFQKSPVESERLGQVFGVDYHVIEIQAVLGLGSHCTRGSAGFHFFRFGSLVSVITLIYLDHMGAVIVL